MATEQELRLRAIARRRKAEAQRKAGDQEGERGIFDRFARGFGGGLADIAGLPIGAAMEAGNLTGITDFENTSGSDFIKSKLEPIGLTGKPGEDLGVAGAVGGGMSMYGSAGLGGTRALMQRGAPMITGAARAPSEKVGTRIVDEMAKGAAKAPTATAAAETSAAGGEALFREMAAEEGHEGWNKDLAALAGGMLGGAGPAGAASATRGVANLAEELPLIGAAKRSAERLFSLEPGPAIKSRASERLRDVAEKGSSPNDSLPAQQALRDSGDVDPSLLTPAQQTNDPGIMSLDAKRRADDPAVLANWRSQVEDNMAALRQQLKDTPSADAQRIQQEYGQNVDDMVMVAAANAERKMQKLTPNQRREQASMTVRRELEDAYRTARDEERALWEMVPEDMVMPAETVKARYQDLRNQLSAENIEDMPQKAHQFLDPDSPQSYFGADDGTVDVIPMKRLQKLRSALMNEARNASSGSTPNRNRARLARGLADGLLDDMQGVEALESPGTGAFNTARDFSRRVNGRFTRGTVGDVLQVRGRGDGAVSAESTLDRTIGRGGMKAQESSKAFIKAFKNPNDSVRDAVSDYLKEDFQRRAFRNGEMSPAGADSFMRRYKDLLDAQPQMRQWFDQAIQDGSLTSAARSVQDGAARVLSKNNPAAEIRRIKNMSSSDETGAVWASFRRGMTSEILERATATTPEGEILSGTRLNSLINGEKTGPALRQAFTKTELANLKRIANTASRIEKDIGVRQAKDLVTDKPSAISSLLAGYTGAIAGAKASKNMGGGVAALRTSNLVSSAMQKMVAKGVRDPAAGIISKALSDKKMMDSLFQPVTQDGYMDRVYPRINAWLMEVVDEADKPWDEQEQ